MKLEEFGYKTWYHAFQSENELNEAEIGRVISEHKERYIVRTVDGDFESEITGNIRFTAQSREDFPVVGDWVHLNIFDGSHGIIHKVFPRISLISRQAVGKKGEVQPIAANVDYAFLVQAVDRDFNINRLERYLTLCYTSKVKPIIVLTKTDLLEEEQIMEIRKKIEARIKDIPVFTISNVSKDGFESLENTIQTGETYCLLGSSGVGKSTLLNILVGKSVMYTNTISDSTNKGRHSTTHREMVILEGGGIVIDNPGIREVGISDTSGGLETTFDQIVEFAQHCRYKNCSHTNESGCAVIMALENGDLDSGSYENYLKMEKERTHFESSVYEKRKKDKDFGKMIKHYKNVKKTRGM